MSLPTTTILMLSANPKGTDPLRLDEERREIEAGLMERSRLRDNFCLITKTAVRPRDFQRAMLDLNPQIVHFSGHGGGEPGLVLEDDAGKVKFVDGEALAGLFSLFPNLQCVVLNACYSEAQATAIAHHIPYVIGMNQAIGDKAAISFAVGFYDALGAGRDVEFAYKLGCAAIRLEGISEHLPPVLIKQSTTGSATVQSKLVVPSPPTPPTPTASPAREPIEEFIISYNSKLTGRQRQDLETERAGLQRRYDLLSQKIQRLGEALDIETDPATRFKLEIQLQQVKEDRGQISREMADVDSKLDK